MLQSCRARLLTCAVALVALSPTPARCQPTAAGEPPVQTQQPPPTPLTADTYSPITGAQRVDWIVDGTIGRKSLFAVGPLATMWQTAFNTPEEWGRGASGIAKRYAQREADVALSNAIEAGLGAIWDE